ncbi:MAG: leucine-rich repeat domain-containing protein [Saprospiraceae bacterium]|nr:leucine-rich repeat domain-containing protein [Saprospiraceae bacterium]
MWQLIKDTTQIVLGAKMELLDLGDNLIEEIKDIEGFKNIKILDFSRNKLNNVDALGELKKVEFLDLSFNLIEVLSLQLLRIPLEIEWKKDINQRGIYVSGNPFSMPPIEIIKRRKSAILPYYTSVNTDFDIEHYYWRDK